MHNYQVCFVFNPMLKPKCHSDIKLMHVRFSLSCCKNHTHEDGMLTELIGLFPFHSIILIILSYNGWQMHDIIVDIPIWNELQIHSPEHNFNILIEIFFLSVKLICVIDQINLQIINRELLTDTRRPFCFVTTRKLVGQSHWERSLLQDIARLDSVLTSWKLMKL